MAARTLAFYAIAYAGSAALQRGVGFVLFMGFAHSMSVDAYAQFGLMYALQTGLAAFAVAGIVEAIVGMLKDHPAAPDRQRLFNAANTVFALLSLAALIVVAVALGALTRSTKSAPHELLMVVVAGLFTAFFTLQAHLTRLEEDHRASLSLNFFPPLIGLLAGFAGYLIGATVASFFVGAAIGLATIWLPFRLRKIGYFGFARSGDSTRQILARLAPFVLIVVLGWLSGYGNTYLVSSFFSVEDVARFTFAYTLSSIMQLVATSLNQVWSPRFFRLVHELPIVEVERRNRRFSAAQGLVLGLVGAGVLAVVPWFTTLAGPKLAPYLGLELELWLLFAAYALSIPWWHAQNYYFAHSQGVALMRVTLWGTGVGMLAWLSAMLLLGAIGVYVGFLLLMVARAGAALAWARRRWSIGVLWEGPLIALTLLGAGTLVSGPVAQWPMPFAAR